MSTSDEDAFLRAVQADPADGLAKLAYADWLEEHGRPLKAEYLRLSSLSAAGRKPTQAQISRLYDLERQLRTWVQLVRGEAIAWDAATPFALGNLRGLLECYAALSGHESDISYDFSAQLRPKPLPVADLIPTWFEEEYRPVRVEPLTDWEAELRAVLDAWLFVELRHLSNAHSRLACLSAAGRRNLVDVTVARVREVLTPTAGWRFHVTEGRFYALDWADIVLESAERVLWLHFSFSD